jgi:hypothetical protein
MSEGFENSGGSLFKTQALTESLLIALFQTKDSTTQAQIDNFMEMAEEMLGKIPGLLSVKTGKAMDITKQFNKGYEWGLVLTFERPEFIGPYIDHPAHTPYVFLIRIHCIFITNELG